jgi:hypothetical protein
MDKEFEENPKPKSKNHQVAESKNPKNKPKNSKNQLTPKKDETQ